MEKETYKAVTSYTDLQNAVMKAIKLYGKGRVKAVVMDVCGVMLLSDVPKIKYNDVIEALSAMKIYWEEIDSDTNRLKVPGGWIVRSYMHSVSGHTVHQIFIEDPEHLWIIQ